jgi:hypothetical protein
MRNSAVVKDLQQELSFFPQAIAISHIEQLIP